MFSPSLSLGMQSQHISHGCPPSTRRGGVGAVMDVYFGMGVNCGLLDISSKPKREKKKGVDRNNTEDGK